MTFVPLSRGQKSRIDSEDFPKVIPHKWYAHWNECTKSFYAVRQLPRKGGKRKHQHLHRLILGVEDESLQVDHKNHDTLDNRKENLCVVSHRKNHENMRNQSQWGPGVRKRPSGRFVAFARYKKKCVHIGTYDTPEGAAKAREEFLEERGCL